MRRTSRRRALRASAALLASSALVLTGCADEEPEVPEVTAEDLDVLEERVGALEDNLVTLNEDLDAIGPLEPIGPDQALVEDEEEVE